MCQCTYTVPMPTQPWSLEYNGRIGKTAIHEFAPGTYGRGFLEIPFNFPNTKKQKYFNIGGLFLGARVYIHNALVTVFFICN